MQQLFDNSLAATGSIKDRVKSGGKPWKIHQQPI
jgi:hypothetical protein